MAESYPISVVIPVRNASEDLRLCLEALFRSDLTAVEIVVVDDASSEAVSSIVSSFEQSSADCSIRCVRLQEHSGPATARNEGLKRAAHPYVLFVDADIVLPEKSLQWIRETLELYGHLPEVVGVLGVYSEKIPWQDFASNFKNLYTCFLYESTETRSPFLHTPIFCVKKEILKSTAGFDSKLATAEDFRLGMVLGAQGYRFIIDRRIRGIHRKRYSLAGILREDGRRARDLRRILRQHSVTRRQRRFYYRAHRISRLLSAAIPGPLLVLLALTPLSSNCSVVALLLLLVFTLCNASFLRFAQRRQGLPFALGAIGFLFLEMLRVELSLLFSIFREG